MPDSSLDPDNLLRGRDRRLGRGHGIYSLGPSDSSDNGSDLLGAPGLAEDEPMIFDSGTTSDPEHGTAHFTAGPDVGDSDLDGDSDSSGTGERATAGRDTVVRAGADIDTDRIEEFPFDIDDDPPSTRANGASGAAGKRGRKS